MGIGASVFLIAAGAILTFAVEARVAGLDIDAVGWILMIVGVIGLVLTFTIWSPRRRTVVVEEPPATVRREPTNYRRVEERRETGPPEVL